MDAIINGHVGVVSLLLDNGADLSIKNKQVIEKGWISNL